jgi:hypothetical protein
MRGAVLYYTCLTHKPDIEQACRVQLRRATDMEIVSIARGADIDFGDTRVRVDRKRSPETMHYQILAGLEATDADYVFLCESDVLYPAEHFMTTPPTEPSYLYDTNTWKVWYDSGIARWTDNLRQVSALCADRQLLVEQYKARILRIEQEGKFSIRWSFEPGCRQPPLGFDHYPAVNWQAAKPSICIRHDSTLTYSKQTPEEFRNPKYARGWQERDGVPGWSYTRHRFPAFLQEIIAAGSPVVV